MLVLTINDEEEMLQLGGYLAKLLQPGMVIFLSGDLGAGKTTLTRGLLRALGHVGAVKSPTYTLVEEYQLANQAIYHFDLYRLFDPEELDLIGIREYFGQQAVCLIEWPERGQGYLPPPDLQLDIKVLENGRAIQLKAETVQGQALLAQFSFTPGAV